MLSLVMKDIKDREKFISFVYGDRLGKMSRANHQSQDLSSNSKCLIQPEFIEEENEDEDN